MIEQNFLVVSSSQVEICTHDEWTSMNFNEGKCKSGEIYGTPRDSQLRKEYEECPKSGSMNFETSGRQ